MNRTSVQVGSHAPAQAGMGAGSPRHPAPMPDPRAIRGLVDDVRPMAARDDLHAAMDDDLRGGRATDHAAPCGMRSAMGEPGAPVGSDKCKRATMGEHASGTAERALVVDRDKLAAPQRLLPHREKATGPCRCCDDARRMDRAPRRHVPTVGYLDLLGTRHIGAAPVEHMQTGARHQAVRAPLFEYERRCIAGKHAGRASQPDGSPVDVLADPGTGQAGTSTNARNDQACAP